MKNRRNIEYPSLFVVLIVFLFNQACKRSEEFGEKLAKVEIGMSQSQVESILGEPDVVISPGKPRKGKEKIWEYYPHKGAGDVCPTFKFDLSKNKLVEIGESDNDDYCF